MHFAIASSHEIFSLKVLASLAIILLATYICIAWILQHRRLRHFRGPRSAAWSNLWLLRKMVGGEMHLDFYKAYKEHG